MTLRISAALLLAVLVTGCTWEGRPDGASANHTSLDGSYTDEGVPMAGPMFGTHNEIVEPLDGSGDMPAAAANEAPVDLPQPAPTTGTVDATSEVEEALTPGTER